MKFGITKHEKFALTAHLVGLQSPNPEYGQRRIRTWDELGVADLAAKLAMGSAGFPVQINPADWADAKTRHPVNLTEVVLLHLLAVVNPPYLGIWSDTLTRLRERLHALAQKGAAG